MFVIELGSRKVEVGSNGHVYVVQGDQTRNFDEVNDFTDGEKGRLVMVCEIFKDSIERLPKL